MTTWRRRTLALLLTLIIAFTIGCRASAAPQATLEFWTISLQPFFTDYIKSMVAAYERANPEVKINWVDVQLQAIEQKLLAAIAGGVPPDVVNLNVEFTVRIAEKNASISCCTQRGFS